MVTVRDAREVVSVLVRTDRRGERVRGMAVMAQDDEEITLVNLIGDLCPEMFNAYMAELDIDAPAVQIRSD